MLTNYPQLYPADQHYESAALENGKQLLDGNGTAVGACLLQGVRVINSGANAVYVLVSDDAAGPHGIATKKGRIYPIAGTGSVENAAPGDQDLPLHGGREMRLGVYIGVYSTLALAIAGGAPDAGNTVLIEVDWSAPRFTPLA